MDQMAAVLMHRPLRAAVLASVVLIARAGSAHAHAFLDHAYPRVGSTVTAPATVTLVFTEDVVPAFSHVAVADEAGKAVATGALLNPEPATLAVSLPALAPGAYTVTWSVISVDTHPTDGHFTFTVRGP